MKIERSERYIYFAIIALMFGLLIISRFVLPNCGENHDQDFLGNSQKNGGLNSFFTLDASGNRELIHFNAYSPNYYVFLIVSPQCRFCEEFMDEARLFYQGSDEIEQVKVVILTAELSAIPEQWRFKKCLQVSRDDLMQFGDATPILIATNGRGEIVFRHFGFYNGIFEELNEKMTKLRFRSGQDVKPKG